jgi:hypothetical protein
VSKVFVLDTNKQPLKPIHSGRARMLLSQGKAAVFRRYPFTVILKKEVVNPKVESLRVKIDPGAKTTGLALVNDSTGEVVWAAQLQHRGFQIRDALTSRRQLRRSRRNRKTRYRKPRFLNRTRPEGWLPPSLNSRVANILTWVNRLSSCNQKKGNQDIKDFLKGKPDLFKCILSQAKPLLIAAKGHGTRQQCRTDKFGFPSRYCKRTKFHKGFQTGDIVKAVVTSGKKIGTYVGRVATRATGSFNISTTDGLVQGISHKYCLPLHKKDGYSYAQ